jgi:hypothetical protein
MFPSEHLVASFALLQDAEPEVRAAEAVAAFSSTSRFIITALSVLPQPKTLTSDSAFQFVRTAAAKGRDGRLPTG